MVAATAQVPKGESRLAGIKLYDSGVDVVKRYGSPNDILPISWNVQGGGGGGAGGGGGFASPPGGGGGGMSGKMGGPAGSAGGGQYDFTVPPLSANQLGLAPEIPPPTGGGGDGGRMGGGGGGAVGIGGGSTGTTETQYVRWVYRRGAGSSFNVVLNKFNKVVQIESIGVSNPGVRTSKGITLGSNVASVVKAYGNPDGYEVGGDYFMMKFLRTHKVAFRFTRENSTAPYRVTGIVVSAGKA